MLEKSYATRVDAQAASLSVVKNTNCNKLKILDKFRTALKFIGPAFIVSVAYIDPGKLELEHI